MNTKEQITEYVEEIFNRYDLDKYEFFFDYDEETKEQIDMPLFPEADIDDHTLERISTYIGLTKQEILNMDELAAKRYYDKYPFFKLYGSFQSSCTWQKFFKTGKPSLNDIMLLGLTKVFPNKNFEASERYDYVDVQHRLVEKLKEIDQVIPGTYHKDAEITNLKFSTKDFISFPKCKQMLTSFIDIVDSAKELFFKALDIELSEEEINELNFLANWLYMSDSVMPSVYLTYDNVRLYRNVYKHEGYKSFLSYAKIRRFVNEEPWRCKEFFDDMSVVQDFINIFPRAKSAMNEFATNVTKFSCEFTWSDAKPIVLSDEEELEFRHSEEYIPVEERRKESTHIYVDKTSEEMFGYETFAQKLRSAASPPSKGGLLLPVQEVPSNGFVSLERIKLRVAEKQRCGGNE